VTSIGHGSLVELSWHGDGVDTMTLAGMGELIDGDCGGCWCSEAGVVCFLKRSISH
jgi:hypothetical protein